MAEINKEPVKIKVFSDTHGEYEHLRNFVHFVNMHKPDIVAMEMLPLGPYNADTAESVTQYFGTQYLEAIQEMAKRGHNVVGLEKKEHRPFINTAAGIWKNMLIRTKGQIEEDWMEYLKTFHGHTVALFCGSFHAENMKRKLGLAQNDHYKV